MSISDSVLKNYERAIFSLRELYGRYGYNRYKVSKFEEYDLYARNKSFLISENILTFTDTDGRLLALKPDVTLSIVKNLEDIEYGTHKICYNENVYRTSSAADGFREIVQTGLECIGRLDLYSVCEVITLAQKSLDMISRENILDISHMGFLAGFMEELCLDGADADLLLELIGHKNIPAIKALCERVGVSKKDTDDIATITGLYAPISEALALIGDMVRGEKMREAYEELCAICDMLSESGDVDRIMLDFSTVNDMSYYNGIIFKGFVNGIPDSILSGGRYDSLMKKMGKRSGAIGFAVYLDMLDRLDSGALSYDVDTVLLYDDNSDMKLLAREAERQRAEGRTVKTEYKSTNVRYRALLRVTERGVHTLEEND